MHYWRSNGKGWLVSCCGTLLGVDKFWCSDLIHVNLCQCSNHNPHRCRLLFYIFKMVILTFARTIAARPDLTDDQINKYPEPLDHFRGVCEALVLLVTVAKILDEILEIMR